MKTVRECVPCFFKQAYDAAGFAGARDTVKKKILRLLVQEIREFDFSLCPSEMGRTLYALVRKITGQDDPFKQIKEKSNRLALALYPHLKEKVTASRDRLLTAVELAIAGNIIDYGVNGALELEKELERIFARERRTIRGENKGIFEYNAFRQALDKTKKILYIGDNAGEIVFDRVLIEELCLRHKEVTFVVKGAPIINDALKEDALFCGIQQSARIISSGCDAPGTILRFCSRDFLALYRKAELIISKGQGNFEALCGERRPIFFLLKAKCPVLAGYLGCKLGDVILKRAKIGAGFEVTTS
ncbi:MAG: ARMT1-like domain-containing protein [Candidatus Omnitrophota bacterium]